MLLRVLGKTLVIGALAGATMLVGVSGVAAASDAPKTTSSQGQPAYWTALKTSLDKDPTLTRQVVVGGGQRQFIYTSRSTGLSMVLAEPAGKSSGISPNLEIVQCASWSFCLRLDRTDQGALAAGASAAIIGVACLLPGVNIVGCGVVSFVVGVAFYYIQANGICGNQLQIELFPHPGAWPKCV